MFIASLLTMIKITINITSCGRWGDLRRLIFSLAPQNIAIQVILTQDVEVPEEFKKYILGVAQDAPSARNTLWLNTRSSIALFLDEDCEVLTPFYLQELKSLIVRTNTPALALGGNYESSDNQNFLQKSYNLVTKIWTLRNLSPSILFLGGHFALYQESIERKNLFDKDALFGGEEFNLHKNLQQQNFIVAWQPQLKVIHHPSSSWMHFFQRALQHSKAQAHPTPITKDYLRSLYSLCKEVPFAVMSLSFFYLCLVYVFRLSSKASSISTWINLSKFSPELLAEREKSSVGSRLGFAFASRKNK